MLASIRISAAGSKEAAAAAAGRRGRGGSELHEDGAAPRPARPPQQPELRNSLHRAERRAALDLAERLPVASGERAPIVYTKSASGERLPHAYAARALYDHVGDEAVGTLSAAAAPSVLVQGDRAYEEPAGWMYCCSCGAIGLPPAAFLAPASTVGSIPARAVFSFDAQGPAFAGDQQELSFAKGQLLSLMPTEADPVGWDGGVGGARGIVPQNYVQPEVKPAPPSAPAPRGGSRARRRRAARGAESARGRAGAGASAGAVGGAADEEAISRRRCVRTVKLRARGGGASTAAAADPRPIWRRCRWPRGRQLARFDAKEAMDQIFQLGRLIAKARQASDAHEWRAHVARCRPTSARGLIGTTAAPRARPPRRRRSRRAGGARADGAIQLALRERAISRQLRTHGGAAGAWDADVIPTGESTSYQRAAQAREAIARRAPPSAAEALPRHRRPARGGAALRLQRALFGSGRQSASPGRAGRKRSESPRRAAAKTPQRGRVLSFERRRGGASPARTPARTPTPAARGGSPARGRSGSLGGTPAAGGVDIHEGSGSSSTCSRRAD